MNTISASILRRRGVAALDEGIRNGPLHIVQSNQPKYVVLTEEQYTALTANTAPSSGGSGDIWDIILNRPWQGTRMREDVDAYIREERKGWGEP